MKEPSVFGSFINYNKKLFQIVGEKFGLFVLLFAVIALVQVLMLKSPNFASIILRSLLEVVLVLLILFVLLYPIKQFTGKTLDHLKKFVFQRYIPVLLCFIVFTFCVIIGTVMLIIPGIVFSFFFQYAYLYVALEGNNLKDAFLNSAKLVKRTINLNLILIVLMFAAYFPFSSGSIYSMSTFSAIGVIYFEMLKAIILLDKSKVSSQKLKK